MAVGAKEVASAGPRVALLAGASGLTGAALLRLLLRTDAFARVIAVSRRPLSIEHARLANRILRFDEVERALRGLRCTDAFCTLGAAGGPRAAEAELRAVDLDLVEAFARAARSAGATRLVVVSAAGAHPQAAQPFLRVKGEMEAALRPLGFQGLDILQPGVVTGRRDGDGATALLRQGLLALGSPLLRRSVRGLATLHAGELANAMLTAAVAARPGVRICVGGALASAARGLRSAP